MRSSTSIPNVWATVPRPCLQPPGRVPRRGAWLIWMTFLSEQLLCHIENVFIEGHSRDVWRNGWWLRQSRAAQRWGLYSWAGTMLGFDLLPGPGEVRELFPPVARVLAAWTADGHCLTWGEPSHSCCGGILQVPRQCLGSAPGRGAGSWQRVSKSASGNDTAGGTALRTGSPKWPGG